MSAALALASPRRIKASHRRRRRIASGHFVQRYYDQSLGRFLSVDPVTAYSGDYRHFNRYVYAYGNPYRYTDPDGRAGEDRSWWDIPGHIADWANDVHQLSQARSYGVGASIASGANGATPPDAKSMAAIDSRLGERWSQAASAIVMSQTLFLPPAPSSTRVFATRAAQFATDEKLLAHFLKHGNEFGAKTAQEYLSIGQGVMRDGMSVIYKYKGEKRFGYIQYMGNTSKGKSKFAFVGTDRGGNITTIHTQSGNSLWRLLNNGKAEQTITPFR